MFELMQSYQIELPSIGVFRRGMMNEYRGPLDVKGIARFLKEDAKVKLFFSLYFNPISL